MSGAAARKAQAWGIRWALLMCLWVVLVDSRRWQELAVGAAAACVGATLATRLRWAGRRPETGAARLLRPGPAVLARPLIRLITDLPTLAVAVRRPHEVGRVRVAEFRPEPRRQTATGRSLTEIWGSLAGNRYVIGVDEETGTIVVHELVRSEAPLDPLAKR